VMFFRVVVVCCVVNVLISPWALAQQVDAQAEECMALNLYWEARSEGVEGMTAVGWVVLNRLEDTRYPVSVCGVIKQGGERRPCQWSWWCDGRSDRPRDAASWALAQDVTANLLNDPPPDPTDGALYFHLDSLSMPGWLADKERTVQIGRHIFYR